MNQEMVGDLDCRDRMHQSGQLKTQRQGLAGVHELVSGVAGGITDDLVEGLRQRERTQGR